MGIFGDTTEKYEAEQQRLSMPHGRSAAIICEQINAYGIPKISHIIYLFRKTAAAKDLHWMCFKTAVSNMVKMIENKDIIAWDDVTKATAAYTLSLIDAQIEFTADGQPKKAELMRSAWKAALTEAKSNYQPLALEKAQAQLETAEIAATQPEKSARTILAQAEPPRTRKNKKPAPDPLTVKKAEALDAKTRAKAG